MFIPSQAPAIDDLRNLYKKRVPKMFYDYCETGSYTTQTFQENTEAFKKHYLRQRVAVNVDHRSTESTILGQKVAMPVALAPIGSGGMNHADGEIHACRAAQKFGVPYTLSTMSVCSIEEVAANVEKPFWFQLYVMRERAFTSNMIMRAKAAKCSALVLTLDLQILAQRHLDVKNGLSTPPKPTLKNWLNIATKPRWALGMMGTRNRKFGNIHGHAKDVKDMADLAAWTHRQFDPSLDWSSVDFIRKQWDGPLILKGINDVEDAKIAAKKGCDAIIVSNHGGRQLDGCSPTIDMLGPVVDAVGKKVEVWFDSGIRTGMDVMKALAMGAKATMIGRAYIYGLGAGGEAGVSHALNIIQKELHTTMGLCGERNVAGIGRHNLLNHGAAKPR